MKILNESISAIINGYRSKKSSVNVPKSKFVASVLSVLQAEGYLGEIKPVEDTRMLSVELKYHNRLPVVKTLKFISHGGYLEYRPKMTGIPRNFSVYIMTTSRGVMTHMQATKLGIGGKMLLEVF
jgi:small subunit ribosomal protein S8